MSRKTLRIAVTDIGPHAERLTSAVLAFVDGLYEIEFTNDYDADYVFHSCLGYDVLKYKGIRIYITEENVSPNFNISDYAMAFDRMAFGDRYCRLPLIKLYRESYAAFQRPRPPASDVLQRKTDFCAYVMSSTRDSAEERIRIFELLNDYRTVHSGGKWNNNVGGPVPNKLEFQRSHKFVIACENCSSPGYLTEKFADAAAADAVPIYWGDPSISEYFNTRAFVNCHDFPSLEAAVEFVRKIDRDDDLYLQMLSEPWFVESEEPAELKDETYIQFLRNLFDQDRESAFRRNRSRWGLKQERILYRMYDKPLQHGVRRLRTKWLELYHKVVPRREYQG